MPKLPDSFDVDGRAAPRPSYNVPEFPRNPVPAAIKELGQTIMGVGADIAQQQQRAAARAAAESERRQKLALQTGLLQMESQWGDYSSASESSTGGDPGVEGNVDPGTGDDVSGAGDVDYDAPDPGVYVAPASDTDTEEAVPVDPAGTASKRVTEFDAKAKEFISSVPDEMKPYADASLYKLRTRIGKRVEKFERKESERFYSVNLSNGLDTILDRMHANPEGWQEDFKQGEDLYDLHPTASPGQKAVWKEKWRTRAGKRLFEANPQYFIDYQKQEQAKQPKAAPAPAPDTTAPTKPVQVGGGLGGAIKKSAAELGISPVDLATVISYETGGKFSTSIMGGKGGRYMGLIQFGPAERKQYGASANQTLEQQMEAVTRYLKDRGLKPGMGLADLYSTINAGTPGRYKASDRAGYTVARHVKEMASSRHRKNAEKLVGGEEVQVASNDPTIGISSAEPVIEPIGNDTNYGILGENVHPALQSIPYEDRVQMAKDVAISYTDTVEADLASIKSTGVPVVANPESMFSGMEPAKAQDWLRNRALNTRHHEAVTDMQSLSETEIAQRIEMERPQPGSPNFKDEEAIFEGIGTAGASIIAARKKDPAGYVMETNPEVIEAWGKFDPKDPNTSREALAVTIEAQKAIGIRAGDIMPLPAEYAEQIAEIVNDPEQPADVRLKTLVSMIAQTPDETQQRGIYKQLVKSSVPASVEVVVDAYMRGDTGAARRLFDAAMVKPEQLPGKGLRETGFDDALSAALLESATGKAFYALDYRDPAGTAVAQRDFALAKTAATLTMMTNPDQQAAIEQAVKDIQGDVTVIEDRFGSGGGVYGLVDKDTNVDNLTAGMEAVMPRVIAAADALKNKSISNLPANVQAGARNLIESTHAFQSENLLAEGVFRPYGNGWGFYDPYSNSFLPSADGTALVFSTQELLQAGVGGVSGGSAW